MAKLLCHPLWAATRQPLLSRAGPPRPFPVTHPTLRTCHHLCSCSVSLRAPHGLRGSVPAPTHALLGFCPTFRLGRALTWMEGLGGGDPGQGEVEAGGPAPSRQSEAPLPTPRRRQVCRTQGWGRAQGPDLADRWTKDPEMTTHPQSVALAPAPEGRTRGTWLWGVWAVGALKPLAHCDFGAMPGWAGGGTRGRGAGSGLQHPRGLRYGGVSGHFS